MAEVSCPSCAAPNPSSQRFCGECGAPLARACGTCGAENPASNRFCGSCGASFTAPPKAAPGEERRWATVVFADLVGFTALAETMDPEDVKALAARSAERVGDEIRRFDGTVITVLGDSLMAVFGAPLAHEDDEERALRAALAMLESVKTVEAPRPLALHIGINTGEVMAGVVGPDARRDYTAMGDTTNTAARLMSAAPAGCVYVGEETYRATRRVVQYREVGEIAAKGKGRPVRAWQALAVARIPAPRPLGTSPLVGRERELGLLQDIWNAVSHETRPYLVTVLGEPGVGKTRLVSELEHRALQDATVLHGRCLPHGELGYGAFATALKEAAGIAADEPAEAAREKLDRLVSEALGAEEEGPEIASHLARLAGLEGEAEPNSAPDQRALGTSARRFLEALARRRPTCLVFEDIHWADDSLLDLIEFVASHAGDVPLLIIAQARPGLLEARPAWGRGVRAFASVPLEPLGGEASRDLARVLCREGGLQEALAEGISRQCEGNPLFAEELVAMVTERGEIGGVPSSIKALISARLDSLPAEERACLQHASVFGKVFWKTGVEALGAPGDVPEALEALSRKGLLRAGPRSEFRGDSEYSFKHDLIRDVAYETLPKARRRDLHGRVAGWFEQAAGGRAEELDDRLAHHALEADQKERALGYLDRGAERARRAAAHREEVALLTRAIDVAGKLGRAEVIAGLQTRRGRAFAGIGMWAEARSELVAALDALPAEAVERRAEVCSHLAMVTFWALDVPSMGKYAAEALKLAEEVGRDDLAATALGWLGGVSGAEGNLPAMLDYYGRGMARAGGVLVSSLGMYPLGLWWVGRFAEAGECARSATAEARKAGDTVFTMFSLPHMGLSLASSGCYADAARVFGEARRYGREHGMGPLLARATAMSAGLHLDVFDYAGAEAIQQEARELGRSHGFAPAVVSASVDLMLNLARRGDPVGAERLVSEVGEAIAKAVGWHGWLWRLRLAEARAETALAHGDGDQATVLATDALAQSRGKRPKYEALALTTRGRAHAAGGRTREAIADGKSAVAVARSLGDPAVLLHAVAHLLELEGDDALAAEARATVERISKALPEGLRQVFEDAEPVRALVAR